MPNAIEQAKKYIPILDAVYQEGSKSSILDGAPELAKEGANAGELLIAKISMDGMADYNRSKGYEEGDVTLTWESVKADYDRGRMFVVDDVENQDAADLSFGKLSGEFIRTKVVPEIDAVRFAKYCKTPNITKKTGALTSGENVIKALREAATTLDEAEVSKEERYLFITPTLKGLIDDLDTTKSKKVMDKFAAVIEVPQSRFYSDITLKKGGYDKTSTTGKDINFLIVTKSAVAQYPKHAKPKVVTPEQNQNADAYKFGYRLVAVAQVYENKAKGIYAHTVA